MSWCSDTDVTPLLSSQQGANWGKSDIQSRIIRAETIIKTKLLAAYGASTVSAWTNSTVPSTVKNVAATLSAMLIKSDFILDYKINDEEKIAIGLLKDLVDAKAELFDSTGAIISRSGSKVLSSTSGITRTFTRYQPDQDDFGKGSLDSFGPATSADEDYPGQDA